MPTKPLDRLLFAQGGLCFFCRQPLPESEASVEHLVAQVNGGANHDQNCVACCKTVNGLLGSMSLKEKFQVVLNQKGQFKCPNRAGSANQNGLGVKPVDSGSDPSSTATKLETVVTNLKSRQTGKPQTVKTLSSTIRALFNPRLTDPEAEVLIQQLISYGMISFSGNKVNYAL